VYAHNDKIIDSNLQSIHVDFYSPDKKLVDHQVYLSYFSSSYGQYKIPKNYPYSVITMIVYKNQLNSLHPNYFQKEIYILNPSASKNNLIKDSTIAKRSKANHPPMAVIKENGFVSVNLDNSDLNIKGINFNIISAADTIFNNHYVLTTQKNLSLKIQTNLLDDGFHQFAITNDENKVLLNQYIFNNTYKYLMTPSIIFDTISTEPGGYNLWKIKSLPLANLSISVIDADIPSSNSNIASELLFNSSTNFNYKNIGSYFNDTSFSTIRKFDAFVYEQNVSPNDQQTLDSKNYFLFINGKVNIKKGLFKNPKIPPFINIVVGAPNKKIILYQAMVKPDSSFSLSNLLFFDTAYARGVINGTDYFKENYEITIDTNSQNTLGELKIDNSLPIYYFDHLINSKVTKIQSETLQLDSLLKSTTLKEVVVKSDQYFKLNKLDDMYSSGIFGGANATRLNVEEDPFFKGTFDIGNYITASIPGISYDPNYDMKDAASSTTSLKPIDESYKTPFTWRGEKTSIYLDEMKVDYDFVKNLPKASIGYIKVFRPIFFGESFGGAGGAVSIYTKKFSSISESYAHNTSTTMIKGYNSSKSLEDITDANEYSFKNTGTTLYWNPMVNTASHPDKPIEIRFKNNHFTKAYKIRIEGVDVNGQVLFFEKVIHP